jgi:hypothetical protein
MTPGAPPVGVVVDAKGSKGFPPGAATAGVGAGAAMVTPKGFP